MAGALDGDTARTLASGRETVGGMLSAAQTHLKKVFLAFVVGMMLTIWALRAFIWDRLKTDLVYNRMTPEIADRTEIVVVTPFDVILLQVKIGLIMGIIAAIPVLVWYSRDSLRVRGIWPDSRIPRWKIAGFLVTISLLFVGGISYAYFFFFPIMFDFLAVNAVAAGFKPTWSIVLWTEFIFFLSMSFGIAAQLPLVMSAVARSGIVPYETFRDKWRYAVVGIFVFGAMFSPPDPFTQVMWGVPLVALYFVSLGITKLAVLSKQAGEQVPMGDVAREHWNFVLGMALVGAVGVYAYLLEGGTRMTNDALESIGSSYRVAMGEGLSVVGLPPSTVAILVGVLVAGIVVVEVLFYLRIVELEATAKRQAREATARDQQAAAEPEADPDPGEPAEIDIGSMSAKAIEATPAEAFVDLSESRALEYANDAIEAENQQKAQAILDKFDEAQDLELEADEEEEDEEELVTSTAAGMMDPFTEDETTEDDIGGYYYDIAFIVDSLTSKTVWIVGVFMVVLAGTFMALYRGGIGYVTDVFFRNMPASAVEEPEIVVLHPVEALIFMIKFSTLLGFLSVIPLILYFAWPAIEERGFSTGGDRNVLLVWGGTMLVTVISGTLLGFLYIAPTILSLLANDVVNSNMVIAYRISSFGWLVIYLTVGVGLLTMIPMTMVLFYHGNIISYQRMRKSWRGVVLSFFAVAGFASPKGIFTMFIVAIPAGIAYGIGLGIVWFMSVVTRSTPSRRSETAD
jgi:sec-independent protein translocase protein TatC